MRRLAKQRELKAKADPPFDFAQGRLFGDDNKKSKCNKGEVARPGSFTPDSFTSDSFTSDSFTIERWHPSGGVRL